MLCHSSLKFVNLAFQGPETCRSWSSSTCDCQQNSLRTNCEFDSMLNLHTCALCRRVDSKDRREMHRILQEGCKNDGVILFPYFGLFFFMLLFSFRGIWHKWSWVDEKSKGVVEPWNTSQKEFCKSVQSFTLLTVIVESPSHLVSECCANTPRQFELPFIDFDISFDSLLAIHRCHYSSVF